MELLGAIGQPFTVQPANIPEPLSGDAVADATTLAQSKASAVASRHPGAVVIAADTLVFDELRSYGKPADTADATAMLARLQGRAHRVVTGVAVASGGAITCETSVSKVMLHPLSYHEIVAYVASGRPLDKAGAYAIQDQDVPTVDSIDGCYCSVMGLPLWRSHALLERAGITTAPPNLAFERCSSCPERATNSAR